MPTFRDLLNEVATVGGGHDVVRRKYLLKLHEITGRNVIAYYSAWLQKIPTQPIAAAAMAVNDSDKNGFMASVHELDRSRGLDLILHTPGGDTAATESIVDYLRAMFGTNIRAIVPQLAMSAGTMIACACREIVMGRHSSLGPIDPQISGVPAHGVIEEFTRAAREIAEDRNRIPLWQPIIAKYSPTFVGECEKAIVWSNDMVAQWLKTGMFNGDADATARIERVIAELADHALTKSHARHISMERAQELGLKIVPLEDDDPLQDAVLSVHHAYIVTLSATAAIKITENHRGVAFITQGA